MPTGAPSAPPGTSSLETVAGHLLVALTVASLPPSADDVAVARVLGELLVALRLHDGLGNGVYPPRGSVPRRSPAMAGLEAAVARVVRRYRDAASAAGSPTSLPAGLEVAAARAGRDLQAPRSSPEDVITLAEAALLLGVGQERARQLVHDHGLRNWRESGGRHRLQVVRGEVIALREHRSGGHGGTGGGEAGERAGDSGGAAGGRAARGGRAA